MKKLILLFSLFIWVYPAFADELDNEKAVENNNSRAVDLPSAMVIRVSDSDKKDVQIMYSEQAIDPKTMSKEAIANSKFNPLAPKKVHSMNDPSIKNINELDRDNNFVGSWFFINFGVNIGYPTYGYPTYGYGYGYPFYGYSYPVYPTYYYGGGYYPYVPFYGYGYGGYRYSFFHPGFRHGFDHDRDDFHHGFHRRW